MLLEIAFVATMAMQDSVQTCGWVMGQWVCRTTDGRTPYQRSREEGMARYNDNFAAGAALGARLRQQREAEDAARAARATATLRRNVITRIQQGDCEGAVSVALDGGDLALATEARTLCQRPAAPAQ